MSRPIVINHDVITGEITENEMNDAEFLAWQKLNEKIELEKAAEANKEAAKQTAQAKLAALGLTADELKALGLGSN